MNKSQKKSVRFATEEEPPIYVNLDTYLNPIIECSADKFDSTEKLKQEIDNERKITPKNFEMDNQ